MIASVIDPLNQEAGDEPAKRDTWTGGPSWSPATLVIVPPWTASAGSRPSTNRRSQLAPTEVLTFELPATKRNVSPLKELPVHAEPLQVMLVPEHEVCAGVVSFIVST